MEIKTNTLNVKAFRERHDKVKFGVAFSLYGAKRRRLFGIKYFYYGLKGKKYARNYH
ncbi:hypothetical protein MYX07_00215 [Patescibacteria group bacterium AH-259-L07]|nr:hypothetical protein [Patescibacteria group bacterium AH-259-L07]